MVSVQIKEAVILKIMLGKYLIEETIPRPVKHFKLENIILFGSYAYGNPDELIIQT